MQADEIVRQACAKVGLAPIDHVPNELWNYAWSALNRIYSDVWMLYPFRDEKLSAVTVSVAAATTNLILPANIDCVRALRSADDTLFPLNEFMLADFDPTAFADTGTAEYWFPLSDVPVLTQPTVATAISVVSTAADAAKVRVFGTTASGDVAEDITLNGTTPVAGTTLFSIILQVSKAKTVGHVNIRQASTVLGTIYSWDTQASYRRIRLYPIADATTLYLEAAKRFIPLVSIYDTIVLRHAETAIFDYLTAELYELNGEPDRATAVRATAQERLQAAMNREELTEKTDLQVSWPPHSIFAEAESSYPIPSNNTHLTY